MDTKIQSFHVLTHKKILYQNSDNIIKVLDHELANADDSALSEFDKVLSPFDGKVMYRYNYILMIRLISTTTYLRCGTVKWLYKDNLKAFKRMLLEPFLESSWNWILRNQPSGFSTVYRLYLMKPEKGKTKMKWSE